jgi:hypothetical protein
MKGLKTIMASSLSLKKRTLHSKRLLFIFSFGGYIGFYFAFSGSLCLIKPNIKNLPDATPTIQEEYHPPSSPRCFLQNGIHIELSSKKNSTHNQEQSNTSSPLRLPPSFSFAQEC